MRISDWSSDVCSSDLLHGIDAAGRALHDEFRVRADGGGQIELDNAPRLASTLPGDGHAGYGRAFGKRAATHLAQRGKVYQHIAAPITGNDEAISPYRVEPLHSAIDTEFPGDFGKVGH